MIEPTDEMERVLYAELAAAEPGQHHAAVRRALSAVLALVERDHCLERKGHVYHPLMARPQ